ncbi:MAG: flagellar basal body-associated FliL family protein [Burkholderiales bacterium]|jgi:flagellar protein FliL|nr:flagellar basal body-associated FliL family protein [Burkholderiales bacterium]
MAKAAAKAKTAESEDGAAPKKGKGKLFLIIGLVVLLAGGGGGAWFFLQGKKGGDETAEAKPKPKAPPVFEKLEPFVVNLADRGRYLQVAMELKVSDAKTGDQIKKVLPEIRNGILMVLSGKRAEEVTSADGKLRLQLEIRHAANRALGIEFELPPLMKAFPEGTEQAVIDEARAQFEKLSESAKASIAKVDGMGITDVLFTSFVIQ